MGNPEAASPVHIAMRPVPVVESTAAPRVLPKWRVLLHNDDENSTDRVVAVLRECVTCLSEIEASCIMWGAHTYGVSLVIVEPQEAAEFHHDRLASFGLVVTMEPED